MLTPKFLYMPKSFYFSLFLFLNFSVFSQNIVIRGKILDINTQAPLESATIYFSSVKDSSVIDYTISDKNGIFKIETKKITKPFFLKIAYIGYQTYKLELPSLIENKDFGNLFLETNSNSLAEVVVKSEAPPIRIKKDTLEFNASSFKVRPDANVEALLKQLPGVEVASDGKITVNGKEVSQILVNGKPFFDKDGKVALQSLPSDIINKVQITDTKTKKEELTKQAATSNNASINLTIDEDKNKGFFGKFMGGYGTDDRYETSALINYFKNKRKISVLASSNNINSTGFSQDEIFDNMGGYRNMSTSSFGDGSYGIGGIRFGGGKGIVKSNLAGINYADEWGKKLESNGSYFFSNSNSQNINRTKQINLLPTGNLITESNAKTNEDRFGNNFTYNFEYKIDSTTTLEFTPKFVSSKVKFKNDSFQSSKDENNELLNESTSNTFDENDTNTLSNSIYFSKSFLKKGRSLYVSVDNKNSKEEVNSLNKSTTIFYQSADPDDVRDQIKNNRNLTDEYTADFSYSEPLKDSLSIRFGVNYRNQKQSEDRKTFDFDNTSQSYSVENPTLTNYIQSTIQTITPVMGFSIGKEKLYFSLNAGPAISQFNNRSLYLGNTVSLEKNYILPDLNAYINYKLGKSKSVWMSYNYQVDFASANQILPVENLANPLNTYIGNANLEPNKYHSFYGGFRNFDNATRSGYSFYCGGNIYDNQIVSTTIYNNDGKRISSYENVSGIYNAWVGGNWSKTIKKEANVYKFSVGFNSGYSFQKGFTNGELFDAKSINASPRIGFTYEYGELLTINPTYNFRYSDTKYTNYLIGAASNVLHTFNIQTTNYWPKNWVFGNDFGYTYNSNIADGFKKDFYLWNTSLAYNFFNKKMSAKVKVYDILNQNQSNTRTITPTAIRDEENIVLKRYLMFSLTYKIEKFAGKEKPARGNRYMF